MFKKLFTISLVLALMASFLYAKDDKMILRSNGEKIALKSGMDLREAIRVSKMKTFDGELMKAKFHGSDATYGATPDTISHLIHGGAWNTNFGFFGQDVMFSYFAAPADMTIKAAGFSVSDATGASATVGVRLMKFNWDLETLRSFTAPTYMGFYPSDGDGFGGIDPFGEEATGDWQDSTGGEHPTPPWAHDDYDLWSDGGFTYPMTPVDSDGAGDYQWVEMSVLGNEPNVLQGEIVAVVLVHNGVVLDGERMGFYSDNTIGWPSWKFYENGRFAPGDGEGWWVRLYAWDFALAVELTGDRAPVIYDTDALLTTLSTDARTVTTSIFDDNPSGNAAGVAAAHLMYSVDGADFVSVTMTMSSGTAEDGVWEGQIPGQAAGSAVEYYVHAVDNNGNEATGSTFGYNIFEPSGASTLLAFNGLSDAGYPQDYYFRQDRYNDNDERFYDKWAYGPLTEELVENYTNIFEIATDGPDDYNRDVVRTWLEADGSRNYFLAGEEWLGADNSYTDQDYSAGDFEFDILGVAHSYNDVSYDGAGQNDPSLITAVAGSGLGGALAADFAAFKAAEGDTAVLLYDPVYEIGIANWVDAFDAAPGAEVDVEIETRGIGGSSNVQTLPAMAHHTLGAGNKVAFTTMDPISINSDPYVWWSDSTAAPHYQAAYWFDVYTVGVEDGDAVPAEFSLVQNYPNPFNPSTKISFKVPAQNLVSLKVFNVLGQEVATLVNEVKNVGTYEIKFNAANLSSGVYFYTLQAGDFTSTKKMMLIK